MKEIKIISYKKKELRLFIGFHFWLITYLFYKVPDHVPFIKLEFIVVNSP